MSDSVMARLNVALKGRYRIERELGEGGMATVYLAQDVKHNRQVAVKVLKPELSAVVGAERFLAEIETTANLQHPHILPLFDSGEADGFLFYVMPYVEGESLRDRLERERQLPVDEAVRIASDVAEALHAAHEGGVVHRDIKPANILLSGGRPLVADFGIALAVSSAGGSRMTDTGLSLGTPSYMSPEQATADHSPGPRSDIYSLGCVLYEMLTGEPPFTGPTAHAILGKLVIGNPPLPTEHRPRVPAHVEAAILTALEKLPADRFGSAEAFARALGDTSLRHPRQEVGAGSGAAGSWLRRRPSQAALAVALLGVVWAVGATLNQPEPAPRPVIRDQIGDLGAEYPFDLNLSPDGQVLAWKELNTQAYYLRRLDSEETRLLAPAAGGSLAGFSPDGRWLLGSIRGVGDGGMVRISPRDGRASPVLADPEQSGYPLDWTEDGVLYATSDSDSIMLLDSIGGTSVPLAALDLGDEFGRGWLERVALLPGARYIVYHTGVPVEESELRVYDTQTGTRRTLLSHGLSPTFVAPDLLFFMRSDGTLHVTGIDPATASLTRDPIPVQESVFFRAGNIVQAAYEIAGNGDAVFLLGGMDVLRVQGQMVSVDPDGTETVIPVPPGVVDYPRLSPDGRTLAYVRDEDLHLFDLILNRDERITDEADPVFAVWDPSGERLTYKNWNVGEVMVHDVGTGESVPLVTSQELIWSYPVAWTPDGDGIVLVGDEDRDEPNRDVWIARLGGDTAVVESYLPGTWNEGPGTLSPDGRWFVYQSDEGGARRLYARSFPDPGPAVPVSPADLDERLTWAHPVWGPEGDFIYWQTVSGIMATDVTAGATLEVGETRRLPVGESEGAFDVMPDGRLIMVRPVEQDDGGDIPPPRLIHVSNWLSQVRAMLEGGG